jgi:hypothetical protein
MKGIDMNALKYMEIIFTVALGVACSALYIGSSDGAHEARAATAPASAVAVAPTVTEAAIPVVVITGKRMTPQEKEQSLREEQMQASLLAAGGATERGAQ